jgi:hypothetical protein
MHRGVTPSNSYSTPKTAFSQESIRVYISRLKGNYF